MNASLRTLVGTVSSYTTARDTTFGYSYWRRFHQLPKVMFCAKHREPLIFSDARQFDVLPHEILADKEASTCSIEADCESLEWSYIEFACQVLDQQLELDQYTTRRLLHSKAKQLGIRSQSIDYGPGRNGAHPKITQFLRNKWKCHEMDVTLRRQHSGDSNSIAPLDLALNSQGTLFSDLALIAVGLFGSPPKALLALSAPQDHLEENRCQAQRPGISEWKLLKSYREHQGNRLNMAESLSISRFSVRELLNKRGLPSFRANTDPALFRAIVDYQAGMDLEKACSKHGANLAQVNKCIRQCVKPAAIQLYRFAPAT